MRIVKSTKDGMVNKWYIETNNNKFLIKDSLYRFSKEPISEYIVSKIAKLLELNCVDYDIISNDSINIESKSKWLSKCEINTNILKILPILELESSSIDIEIDDFLNNKIVLENKQTLFDMFLLDAVVANPDRHFGNIHINNEGFVILDNGQSFSSMDSFCFYNNINSSMPLSPFHDDQINFLEDKLDLNRFKSKIFITHEPKEVFKFLDTLLCGLNSKGIIKDEDEENIKNIFSGQWKRIFNREISIEWN